MGLTPGFPQWLRGKESACNAGDAASILGQEDTLEEEMATHSCIPARKILWTEEPGGLHSIVLQELDTTE